MLDFHIILLLHLGWFVTSLPLLSSWLGPSTSWASPSLSFARLVTIVPASSPALVWSAAEKNRQQTKGKVLIHTLCNVSPFLFPLQKRFQVVHFLLLFVRRDHSQNLVCYFSMKRGKEKKTKKKNLLQKLVWLVEVQQQPRALQRVQLQAPVESAFFLKKREPGVEWKRSRSTSQKVVDLLAVKEKSRRQKKKKKKKDIRLPLDGFILTARQKAESVLHSHAK